MGKKNWKEVLRKLAPTIATAVGGPFAGQAVQVLSNAVLGKPDGKEAEIEEAILNATPDDLLKLKQAEHQFKLEMEKLGIAKEQLVFDDIKDARARHMAVKDKTPAILAYIATALWLAILLALFFNSDLPILQSPERVQILMYVLGVTSTLVGMGYQFFLGSSKGSDAKNEMFKDIIAAMQDKDAKLSQK